MRAALSSKEMDTEDVEGTRPEGAAGSGSADTVENVLISVDPPRSSLGHQSFAQRTEALEEEIFLNGLIDQLVGRNPFLPRQVISG